MSDTSGLEKRMELRIGFFREELSKPVGLSRNPEQKVAELDLSILYIARKQ